MDGTSRVQLAVADFELSVKEVREQIDIIDDKVVDLLAERAQLVLKLTELKKNRVAVRDYSREEEVLKRAAIRAEQQGLNRNLTDEVFRQIIDCCVQLQTDRLSLQGK